jgi:hypothetical protein
MRAHRRASPANRDLTVDAAERSAGRARWRSGDATRRGRGSSRQAPSQGYARQNRRIGQGRQSGFRAVHHVAPKSISAWLKS